jgi:hypothetical protein
MQEQPMAHHPAPFAKHIFLVPRPAAKLRRSQRRAFTELS